MNRAEVRAALENGTAPVDLVHTGSCRGMGIVSSDVHGTSFDEDTGVIWCTCCPCCSTPPTCTTCRHVFDAMSEMLLEELERRRQAGEDSQNSQGPSAEKRPAK